MVVVKVQAVYLHRIIKIVNDFLLVLIYLLNLSIQIVVPFLWENLSEITSRILIHFQIIIINYVVLLSIDKVYVLKVKKMLEDKNTVIMVKED